MTLNGWKIEFKFSVSVFHFPVSIFNIYISRSLSFSLSLLFLRVCETCTEPKSRDTVAGVGSHTYNDYDDDDDGKWSGSRTNAIQHRPFTIHKKPLQHNHIYSTYRQYNKKEMKTTNRYEFSEWCSRNRNRPKSPTLKIDDVKGAHGTSNTPIYRTFCLLLLTRRVCLSFDQNG